MSFGRATAIALQAIRLRGCAIGVANTRNLSRLCARFTARIRPLFCTRESASIVAIEVSTDRKMQVVVMYVID